MESLLHKLPTEIPEPINDNHGATKKYVDENSGGGSAQNLTQVLAQDNVGVNQTINMKVQENVNGYLVQDHEGNTKISLGRDSNGHGYIVTTGDMIIGREAETGLISAPDASAPDIQAGYITVKGGIASGTGIGGAAQLQGGKSDGLGKGGDVDLIGGDNEGAGDGGDVIIGPGSSDGGGNYGSIRFLNIPTSDPMISNAVWWNNGVLTKSSA